MCEWAKTKVFHKATRARVIVEEYKGKGWLYSGVVVEAIG